MGVATLIELFLDYSNPLAFVVCPPPIISCGPQDNSAVGKEALNLSGKERRDLDRDERAGLNRPASGLAAVNFLLPTPSEDPASGRATARAAIILKLFHSGETANMSAIPSILVCNHMVYYIISILVSRANTYEFPPSLLCFTWIAIQ